MAYTFTDWATVTDINGLLSATGSDVTLTGDLGSLYRSAAAAEIQKRTQREFVPTGAGVERYFDGSGTELLQVDDYIEVESVEIVGRTGVDYNALADYFEFETAGFPKSKIYIRQGTAYLPYTGLRVFPPDAANIKVTANWGYGATIPHDIWLAHQRLSALLALTDAQVSESGRLIGWTDSDVQEKYSDSDVKEASGWGRAIDETVMLYKKTARRKLGAAQVDVW